MPNLVKELRALQLFQICSISVGVQNSAKTRKISLGAEDLGIMSDR